MIRKNKDIKGISLHGKEYKLSQYADDTQLILDGSEKSPTEALHLLKQYYKMSGLKINIDKTRALWIGSSNKYQKWVPLRAMKTFIRKKMDHTT